MIKHIIFDCDGVLIDTEIVAAEVVSTWLRSQGLPISSHQFIHEHTGKMFSHILQELIAAGNLPESTDIQAVMEVLEGEIREKMRPIDGINEVLHSISLPKSVVSNSHTDYVEEALDKFGWKNHFTKPVFSAELVARGKPSPLVYQLAIDTLGLAREEIIAIEDSYTGVQAARAAGIATIGFLGGSHILNGHAERLQSLEVTGLASSHAELRLLLSDLLKNS